MSDPQTPFEGPSTWIPPVDPATPATEPAAGPGQPTVWGPTPPEPAAPRRRGPAFVVGAVSLVIVVAAGLFVFQATRPKESVNARPLAFSFTKGQSTSYDISMSMNGMIEMGSLGSQPIDMTMDETLSWTVTDVDSDGVATVQVEASDVSGTVNGMRLPTDATSIPSISMQIAPDGRILSAGGLALSGEASTSGFEFPGMGQFAPLLPDKDVAPGESWDKSFSQDFPFGDGKIEFQSHSTFEGYEDVQGTRAAVIRTNMDVPLNFTMNFSDLLEVYGGSSGMSSSDLAGLENASIDYGGGGSFTQKSWVDLDAKSLLKSESTGSFDMTMAMNGVPSFDVGDIHFKGDFTETYERV